MSKNKPAKFTFKKQPRYTGLMAVGHPYRDVDIKHNKKNVGIISAPYYAARKWRVQIAVRVQPTEHEPCEFRWVFPPYQFTTEQDARDWLQHSAEELLKLDLHYFED